VSGGIRLRIGHAQERYGAGPDRGNCPAPDRRYPDIEVEIVRFETTAIRTRPGNCCRMAARRRIRCSKSARPFWPVNCTAMHSLKDMPGNEDTPGLVIRRDVGTRSARRRSGLRSGVSVDDLRRSRGNGFKVGTNAVRRAAYARRLFPEVEGHSLSRRRRHKGSQARQFGNAAAAGGRRGRSGGRSDHGAFRAGADRTCPPHWLRVFTSGNAAGGGAGIVAVECAINDWQTRRILSGIDDPIAHICADASARCCGFLTAIAIRRSRDFPASMARGCRWTASVLDEAGGLFIEASRAGPADRPARTRPFRRARTAGQGRGSDIERSRPVM